MISVFLNNVIVIIRSRKLNERMFSGLFRLFVDELFWSNFGFDEFVWFIV